MDLLEDICRLIEEVLEIKNGSVSGQSIADDIDDWDSLGQLRIIMALEEKYGVRFKTEEMPELNSVEKLTERLGELMSHYSAGQMT